MEQGSCPRRGPFSFGRVTAGRCSSPVQGARRWGGRHLFKQSCWQTDRSVQRLIVTGVNGVGKSHVAARLGAVRPGVPVVSFDAIKLTSGWKQKPRSEIDADLARAIEGEAWILEGGPSLLSLALAKADSVIWLDPPEAVRAWRLIARPWRHLGRTRPELPPGNRDWPMPQYRFAMRSLKSRSRLRRRISAALAEAKALRVWHCRNQKDIDAAVGAWSRAAG